MGNAYIDDKLLDEIERHMEPENALALRVARYTGLRISDVLSLRLAQVREALVTGSVTVIEQKSGKLREIALSPELISDLLWISRGAPDGHYAFPHRLDPRRHRTRQAVWADMRRVMRRMGVEPYKYSPHSARKAYAVDIYARTSDLEYVRKILNHDNIAVTAMYALSDRMR